MYDPIAYRDSPACHRYAARFQQQAFSLLDGLIAIAVITLLLSLAVPSYHRYQERARIAQTITQLMEIDAAIQQHFVLHQQWPDQLSDVGMHTWSDAWGNAFEYHKYASDADNEQARRDGSQQPINQDYDLYSKGADGDSSEQLSSPRSRDDIIRAQNGDYFGLNGQDGSDVGAGFNSG